MDEQKLKDLYEWAVFTCRDEDVKNDIKEVVEGFKRLEKENKRYHEALKKVADMPRCVCYTSYECDCGFSEAKSVAREVLV